MTRKIKKDAERAALDRIVAALALTPDSEPEVGEAPDFIIQLCGQSIGVEITLPSSGEIIDGAKRRAAESEWERLKAAAEEFWSQHNDLRAVNVGVMFKGRVPPRGDHDAFIEEVAAFVRQHSGELQPKKQNFFPSVSSSPLMHRYLKRLVLRTHSHAEWYSNFSGGWVARPNDSNIPGIVKNKSKKKFRPTDELWLVIHCGTRTSEMILELDGVEDFRSVVGLDHSKFDRIFVLTYMGTYEWARTTDDWRQL